MLKGNILSEKAPDLPGVYQFIGKTGGIIYVGKAKNLKNRLGSYFANNLQRKTAEMVSNAKKVLFRITSNEFEAIILEAELIKKYQPKYNSQLKDDKSNLYIVFTKDKYPIVKTVRKHELDRANYKLIIGPFTSGQTARRVLTISRKIIPFATHLPQKRACLYSQMGLCNPCPSIILKTEGEKKVNLEKKYRKNISRLKKILTGKVKTVQRELVKEMKGYAKNQEFEKAEDTQKQLVTLENILNPAASIERYIDNPNLIEDIRKSETKALENLLHPYFGKLNLKLIECYDCAHLAGTARTASKVAFVGGEADKSKYRHFKVKKAKRGDDYGSLKEVLGRRVLADDWKNVSGRPDLIVIDGGKGQVSTALEVISEIAIIGLAKRYETVVIKTKKGFINFRPEGPALRLLQRMRNEAHRFARRYHHFLVKRSLKVS